ncbi:hypothetical protein FFI94_018930 [Rhodococcus sp. KBS0724]|uniref:DUF7257 domain-containing protein n=1 Tax=Rhodococcus sp. KBS0724 TaxID=1179674 RepID=UPI00110E3BD2|nr:hypothetical protein [Rhodococcus sp. KBS0724]TSD47991.1 hypothetical protein FFI94_018930 [Rhodococcus sp. KBS0724]
MTSPDPTTGDGFFDGLGGLAAFSQKTQAQWEAEREAEMFSLVNPIEGFGTWVQSLISWAGGIIHDGIVVLQDLATRVLVWIKNAIANVLELFSGVPFIGDAIGGLADLLRGTDDKATEAVEVAMTSAEDAAEAATKASANEAGNIANSFAIAEANLALGTKADISAIPTNVPGYVTLNPVEDAVFPRTGLAPIPIGVTGKTSLEFGGENYQHDHTLSSVSIAWAQPIYTTALNRYDIGYINATRDRIYNTVGFVIAAQTVTTKAYMFVTIYKMDRDPTSHFPNGNLTRVWTSGVGNVNTIPSTFGNAAQDVRIDLGMDIVADQGDWYAVLISQYGAGRTPRNLLGMRTATISAMSGVHPTRLAMNKSTTTVEPPATLTAAELDNTSEWIPWVCMGQTLGLIKVSLADLFDRANAATLGPNWAVYGVGMDIVSGIARCKRIDHGRFTSRKVDYAQAVYVSQLATDAQAASVKIDAFDRTNADLEDNPAAMVAVRANSDMSHCVRIGIRWGLIEIRLYNAANPNGVTKNSTTRTWAAGDVVELRATDDVVTGKTDFTAYVNGDSVLTWPDLASEASKGAAFRRAAFETASTHRGAIFGYLSIPSVGANEWKARDL